ncbi:MAG: PTS mannose/fructose/sorbose transporter family subunit IID [Elusimicrobia bacterium]|nr:PTS mannose/fructose/sorbose transporter family subunit IID [Elusimicrobiota bacterium]
MTQAQNRTITKLDLLKIMHRSLYIQAVWNFERLQNLGFLFTVVPMIKRLYPPGPARVAALQRHLEFFNTHPYMASFVIGVITSLEEKMANQPGTVNQEEVRSIKAIMSGPLAAIGDAFFWASLRPFSALMGIVMILTLTGRANIIGPLFFLFFFNLFGLYIRFGGLTKGYLLGLGVVDKLKKFNTQDLITVINLLGLIGLGVLLLLYAAEFNLWQNLIFFSTLLMTYGLIRKKVYTNVLIYGVLAWGVLLYFLDCRF